MRSRPLLFSLLFLTAAGCDPESADTPKISAPLAMRFAENNVKIGPRYSGSPGAEKSAKEILAECSAVPGIRAELMEFDALTPVGKLRFRNVVAELPGKSDDFILVAAHYDSKFFPEEMRFDAANDGASGVAALLAMMHALRGTVPSLTIRFVFFDGEEARFSYGKHDGLHGSRHAAAQWERDDTLKRCRAMILLDMIGDRDLNITLPADTHSGLRRIALDAAKSLELQKHIGDYPSRMLDDHVPFQEKGVPAIDLIDFQYGPDNSYWHTSSDTLEHISGESIKIAADITLKMIRRIAKESDL